MSSSPAPDEVRLHQRLLAGDATAPADLATTYFDQVHSWLKDHNSRKLREDFLIEATGDALVSLIKNPASYQPGKGLGLLQYLRMAAQGDLKNILAREKKHQHKPLEYVEDSLDGRKYPGREDDPSFRLRLREEEQALEESIPAVVQDGLTDCEAQVLKLMQRNVRKTSEYVKACGIADLPPAEQRREVKKIKDRLKNRLKRAK